MPSSLLSHLDLAPLISTTQRSTRERGGERKGRRESERERTGDEEENTARCGRCSLIYRRAEPRAGERKDIIFSPVFSRLLRPPSGRQPSLRFLLHPSPPLAVCMMSSSLLENPVQAILYLRELTTIVQNQQSLIQTQRSRIEELDRRVDELIGENRHLRTIRVQQHYPYHHHHHHHPDQSCLPHHHHPQEPQLKAAAAAGSVLDHAAAPAQIEAIPAVQPTPTQPLDAGDMQLVPADPSVVSPVESDPENGGSCQSCRSLVPMTPTTLCRSIALARKSE